MNINYVFCILFIILMLSGCISNDDPDADSILYRINDERLHNNCTMVYKNASLDAVADRRVHDLMNYSISHNKTLTHDIPRTGYPNEALKLYGVGWTSYGEINGYSTNNSSIMIGWKNSSSHYATMMNPTYDKAGVGVSKKKIIQFGI